jgi:hypothetical protein
VTVVIGVVTVTVVLKGTVTVAVVTGVPTVSVADEVGIRSVGRETVGTGSVEGKSDVAADVPAALEPCVD